VPDADCDGEKGGRNPPSPSEVCYLNQGSNDKDEKQQEFKWSHSLSEELRF
jgi:hypothetical protein